MIATTHPLAAVAGLSALQNGGNAVDAAVTAAFTLAVVEPFNTGLGGDMFALTWSNKDKRVRAINGSGPAPAAATIAEMRRRGISESIPETGWLPVTIPGAVGGLGTLLSEQGTMSFEEVLHPAIRYADKGYPVPQVMAQQWQDSEPLLSSTQEACDQYLFNGKAPRSGELVRLPLLAQTLRLLAEGGPESFYSGPIAQAISRHSAQHDGLLTAKDLSDYSPEWVTPISTNYRGIRIYECPPNSQGIVALETLNILESYDLQELDPASADLRHIQIEALRHAFTDAFDHVSDPNHEPVPVARMLSQEHAESRRKMIDMRKVRPHPKTSRLSDGDTVYVTVVDKDHNAVSLISSLYFGFGSGVVAGDTGILMQNRGVCFNLDIAHPNCLKPGKRAYHTIIPALATRDNNLYLSFGLVGGHMQAQGHVQLVNNLVDFGLDVQSALDFPRFRLHRDTTVTLEDGHPAGVKSDLASRGHILTHSIADSTKFGGGQIIAVDTDNKVLLGGSDPRKDGCAIGY